VLPRHKLDDVRAGLDHAALRMIAKLYHHAAHRRGDAHPIEHSLGAQHPLADVGQLAADLMHLLDRRLDRGLAHAIDLLDRAGDAFLGIADVAHDTAGLAFPWTISGGHVTSSSSFISACSLASIAVRRMRRRNSRCNSARAAVSSSSSNNCPASTVSPSRT